MATNEATMFRFYVDSLSGLLTRPRLFFSGLPESVEVSRAVGFLGVSAVVFTAAGLLRNGWAHPVLVGGIQLVNAVGMTIIMASLGWGVMRLTTRKKVAFARFFSIYAFASGATLLAAWVPYFVVFTEPWKWFLIGTGLIRSCGLKAGQAVTVIALSGGIWILFVWFAIPPGVP